MEHKKSQRSLVGLSTANSQLSTVPSLGLSTFNFRLSTVLWLLCAPCLISVGFQRPTSAESVGRTDVTVVVTDAETNQPIYQARLTLQFREPGNPLKLKRSRPLAFSAKTNSQGRYRFTQIPMGTVRLIVTAEHHQTFSKEFEVEKGNQVFEVKLKKPQPLL